MNNPKSGFTLVELVVVVAIVGILAAIAYPSYMSTVRKSNRADATSTLSQLAIRLQRCYTSYSSFSPEEGKCDIIDKLKLSDGVVSEAGFYVIKGSSFTATTYTLTATPVSGKQQANDDECKSFVLTHTGEKSAFDSASADASDICW
ncbi:type IV pilin protein [Cellvibrio mixtus]|uniref:type IV pilin protein n=1 Tax=Cellvibrio mixtus TaxID=39650 RepID=UPI0005873A45|nr:type IV pilin protein [Cellvibrio mixtus]